MKTTAKRIIIGILANVALCINAMALTDALKVKVINGSTSDETVIRFLPSATTGFDGSYDAYKMFSTSPTVPAMFSKIAPTSNMSINALPSLASSISVELFIHIKVAGSYTLQSIELGAFATDATVLLEDKQTGNKYAFRNGTTVIIPMAVNSVSSASRFVIHFNQGIPPIGTLSARPVEILREMDTDNNDPSAVYRSEIQDKEGIEVKFVSVDAYQNANNLVIALNGTEMMPAELFVFNISGQLIHKGSVVLGSELKEEVNIPASGCYIIHLISSNTSSSKKISVTL